MKAWLERYGPWVAGAVFFILFAAATAWVLSLRQATP